MRNSNLKNLLPINGRLQQHASEINGDDIFSECTQLAGVLLGVTCNDTLVTGDVESGHHGLFFQITPEPYEAKTTEAQTEYKAFNNYFYENYGKQKGRCYFDTGFEAFYNVTKAWEIWKHVLTNEDKKVYYPKW